MAENNVWDLVELLEGSKRVGCKWVFKTKCDSNGNIKQFKADLLLRVILKKMALII